MAAQMLLPGQEELTELPDVATVYQVIKTLYHDSNCESKENASKWLNKLQTSVFAWKIADDLLMSRADVETCYFAAQTLRTKLQSSFHELPADSYSSLKDSIINHLKTINESVIQTQLSLAITYLAILVPSWTNPVEELLTKELDRSAIVEILTLLPEELDQSRHTTLRGVGANRRQQFSKYLTSIAPQIITLLINTIHEFKQQTPAIQQQTPDRMQAKIYRCLGAWFQLIDKNDMNQIEPILASIFESLKDPNCSDMVHDAAADTVCGAALLCEDYLKYQQLTHYLLNQVYQLAAIYHHSVANEDLDKSVNYSRIFTEIAESVVDPLIVNVNSSGQFSNNGSAAKLVELLLDCVGHYDYEVAEITFHFWYRFSELVLKKGGEVLKMFGPIANRLLTGLTKHCQLESDQEGLLTSESDLYDFRLRVRDVVKEMVFIIGASNYMRQNDVVVRIHASLQQLLTPTAPNTSNNWETVEAEMFVLSCLIRDIDSDDIVSDIIKLVVSTTSSAGGDSVPKLHCQILATCCLVFGELSDWLEKNPTYLDPVLTYLLSIITTTPPEVASPSPTPDSSRNAEPTSLSSIAASALQPIIGSCAETHLVGNWKLITILIEICSNLDFILNENAAHNLLNCCSTIISTANENQTREQQEQVVVELLKPPTRRLREILDNAPTSAPPAKNDPVIYLDRIAAVFRNLKLKPAQELNVHSLLNAAVSDQVWPLIKASLNHYSSAGDSRIIERTCRCLRFMIRSVRPSWLLQDIATVVCTLYQQFPKHSSYLYRASILIDEFAGPEDLPGVAPEQQQDIVNGLIAMLNAFCMTTFQLLTAPTTELRNHPDTIDDFFRLCTRFLQKRPEKFLLESMLNSILDLTIAAMQLDHREANSSVTKFLIELITTAKDASSSPEAKAIVMKILHDQIGQRLLNTVINCALFTLPSYFVPDMADILWLLIEQDRTATKAWLENALKLVPTQNKAGVVAATPEQLQEFYDTVSQANNPKFVAQSLRYLSRLYR